MVLVYGDTNSTLAGALVASKLNIPVVHVEAGLRSFNRRMPEEINRIMTDHLAAYLFCPTDTAMQNLKNEGVERGSHLVGDIMFDAALHFGREARASIDSALERHFSGGNFVLATIHRQENTDDPNRLERIVAALVRLSRDIPVLLPLHPRTRGRIEAMGLSQFFDAPGLSIVPPLGYFDMLALEQESALILTDSGGVQKEAYFFKVPCVTLRDQTEWGELVRLGWNRLVDVLNDDIAAVAKQALGSRGSEAELPYGEGDTAERIVKILDAAVNV